MPYGKGCDQNENVPPLFNTVDRTEYDQKEDMIVARQVRNVLKTKLQVKFKRMHLINQFVNLSFFIKHYAFVYSINVDINDIVLIEEQVGENSIFDFHRL